MHVRGRNQMHDRAPVPGVCSCAIGYGGSVTIRSLDWRFSAVRAAVMRAAVAREIPAGRVHNRWIAPSVRMNDHNDRVGVPRGGIGG